MFWILFLFLFLLLWWTTKGDKGDFARELTSLGDNPSHQRHHGRSLNQIVTSHPQWRAESSDGMLAHQLAGFGSDFLDSQFRTASLGNGASLSGLGCSTSINLIKALYHRHGQRPIKKLLIEILFLGDSKFHHIDKANHHKHETKCPTHPCVLEELSFKFWEIPETLRGGA